MLGASRLSPVIKAFSEQFQPDGSDFLYRRTVRSAPIRVSAAERDAFVEQFGRHLRRLFAGSIFGTILLIGLPIWLLPVALAEHYLNLILYGGCALVIAAWSILYYRAWVQPARALVRRMAAGPSRTSDEAAAHRLDKLSYGQLGFTFVAAPILLLNAADQTDIFSGWGRLWLLFAVGIVLLAIVQMFRKWRHERRLRAAGRII